MDFAVVDMMTIFAIFKYVTFLWSFTSAFMFLQASHAKLVSYNWIPQWKFYVDLAYTVFWQKPKSACLQWIFTRTRAKKGMVSIALLIKYFCFCGMTLWSWVSCLAIIFFVCNESSWAHVKTKKFGVKTFDCSHCDKKFGLLLWQEFLKFAWRQYGAKTFNCSHCDKKFGLFWQEFLTQA